MDVSIDNYVVDGFVSDDVVVELEKRLVEIRKAKAVNDIPCSTVGGYHTDNLIEDPVVAPLIDKLLGAFADGNKLFTCHWIHMIEYDDGGWAKEHDHSATEQYSFILYLNTPKGGGKTCIFMDNNQVLASTPVRGKILFFPSRYRHLGEPTVGTKMVLVGALNIK